MRKILVTGGAGFIGRKIVERLIKSKYSVTVLDNMSRGDISLVPEKIREQVEWVVGDTRELNLVRMLTKNKDSIIHLAAGSSFYLYERNPVEETQATVDGFLNLLDSMRQHGVKKIVYASTSAVYEGNEVPFVEGMSLNPPDLKSLSKKFNEDMAHYFSNRYGITAIGMRPLNVYGNEEFSKGPFANTVSLFVWAVLCGHRPAIWGDGNQTRDFIYVEDVARIFQLALEGSLDTQEFNVGTGIETKIKDLIPVIQKAMGGIVLDPVYYPVPIEIYANRLVANTKHSEQELGFRAEVTIEEGVKRVVDRALEYIKDKPLFGELQYYVMSRSIKDMANNKVENISFNTPLLDGMKILEKVTR